MNLGKLFAPREQELRSVYLMVTVCSKCSWFTPPWIGRFPPPPREICPKCGADLIATRGRYVFRETWAWWGLYMKEAIRFEARAEASS